MYSQPNSSTVIDDAQRSPPRSSLSLSTIYIPSSMMLHADKRMYSLLHDYTHDYTALYLCTCIACPLACALWNAALDSSHYH